MKLDYIKLHSTAILVGFIISALVFYLVDYFIFKNLMDTISNIIQGIAFIPIQLLLNTILINWVVEKQEEIKNGKKINVIIGVFFSESGTIILSELVKYDKSLEEFKKNFGTIKCLGKECLEKFREELKDYNPEIEICSCELKKLNTLLDSHRKGLVELLTNSFLKEDEFFSEVLMELIHLNDELRLRYDEEMKEYEINHIKDDLIEAYKVLGMQWCDYMIHLYDFYPQLFQLAAVNSPFDNKSKEEKDKIYLRCNV